MVGECASAADPVRSLNSNAHESKLCPSVEQKQHRSPLHSTTTATFCWMSILVVILFLFRVPSKGPFAMDDDNRATTHRQGAATTTTLCNDLTMQNRELTYPPEDSTVLMLFEPDRWQPSAGKKAKGGTAAGRNEDASEAMLRESFAEVSEAFLQTPSNAEDSPHHEAETNSQKDAYFNFLAQHHASLWSINGHVATPLQLDVVYTFVDPAAPSFQANLAKRHIHAVRNGKFFREWGELRYSLRSLHRFTAGLQHSVRPAAAARYLREAWNLTLDPAWEAGKGREQQVVVVPLLRRIYVVVAARDQVPAWLRQEEGHHVHVVTHAELFPADTQDVALPTFNSLAVEAHLHRLAGTTRFQWYFNNDMLLGTRVSLFDLLRPLSPARHLLRRRTAHTTTATTAVATWHPERLVLPQEGRGAMTSLLLEPILHSAGYAAPPAAPAFLSGRLQLFFWRTLEALRRLVGEGEARAALPEELAVFSLDGITQLEVARSLRGVPPTVVYPHTPTLIDTAVMRRMLEDPTNGYPDKVAALHHRYERRGSHLSPVHLYPYYTLAMRRAVLRRQLCQRGSSSSSGGRCPLCGDTNSPQLQHPQPLHEPAVLAFPMREADDQLLTRLHQDTIQRQARTDTLRLRALYADVWHHHKDNMARFYMVEDLIRGGLVLDAVLREQGAATRAPLFLTVNDDLEDSNIGRDPDAHKELMDRLFYVCSRRSPPSPWEK